MRPAIRWIVAGAFLLAAAAGCSKIDPITAPPVNSASADFTRYVALGTSLAAGECSGATVERHQQFSYPAQFAGQIGLTLTRQSYSGDGLSSDGTHGILHINSLQPLQLVPGPAGTPLNTSYPNDFENLGVPGAIVTDVIDSTNYYSSGRAHFQFIVRHRGLIAQQVGRLQPTFISFEYGANEILYGATQGSATPLIPSGVWTGYLSTALDVIQLAAPNAKLAIINVPDPTLIPFSTTFPPLTRNDAGAVVPLIGPGGTPLTPDARVLLTAAQALAAGDGFPTDAHSYVSGVQGTGNPLPDAVVLTSSEVASLEATVGEYNAAIAAEAANRGAALVDFHALLDDMAAHGIDYNGVHYSTAYITGGLFGLDGVHPSDLGYSLIANTMIDAVNAKFGSNVTRVDLARTSGHRFDRMSPAHVSGYPLIEDAQAYFSRMFGAPMPLP